VSLLGWVNGLVIEILTQLEAASARQPGAPEQPQGVI